MKHLKGYFKKYFSLAVIAMYSTLYKLCTSDNNFIYHKKAYKYNLPVRDPPVLKIIN